MNWKKLNCFKNHEKLLLNYLMIILQLYLRLNTKKNHGKGIPSMSARVARDSVAKVSNHSNLKILSPKQMLQRLPIAFARVQAGNTSENLLNEIRRIIYSLYRAKAITKKVYNNIINSAKL